MLAVDGKQNLFGVALCVMYFYTSICVVFITLSFYTDKFSRKQPAIPIKEGCVATTEAMEAAACLAGNY